ncbi:hypothetical protein OG259_10295 [Streptomyces sp. NBC_00250]|uniref:hypothetical protein n=1 Tax=Streptomyces sp. NBC_00250 TaxID=2903641 RepID=UPI002E2A61F0|nr:hypothetical protein [Streptomyces sp. NBC_00250]
MERNDITRNDITRNDITRDDITRDDITRDDITRDDGTWVRPVARCLARHVDRLLDRHGGVHSFGGMRRALWRVR